MIDEMDAEKRSCIFELRSDRNILCAGLKGTRWMIVNADNGCSPVRNGISKHFPGMDKAVVEKTQRYGPDCRVPLQPRSE